MTTRKLAAALLAITSWLALAGCATPGPLHVYSIASASAPEIRDDGPAPARSGPSFLAPGETITGFAYDPFTDHFFLRLAPGNKIRVVDRPARAVKREFTAENVPTTGGGDLAVRPRDGHLFFAHPREPLVIETDRFGKFVRIIPLANLIAPAAGVAVDSVRNRLLVLASTVPRITVHDLDGKLVAAFPLERPVTSGALGYDAEQRELYAPLADRNGVGVFGEDGRWRRTLPPAAWFLDVGPRSFLRMF